MSFQAFSRRSFLQTSAAGLALGSGWMPLLAQRAAAAEKRTKSCILLWMNGGPPHKDTFDLKPDSKGAGDFKPIQTAVPGIQVCELLPTFAKLMEHAVIVRGMSTPEAEHIRARYHAHTARRPAPGLQYPSIGSTVAAMLGKSDFPVPSFVFTSSARFSGINAGFLGTPQEPLFVEDVEKGVENGKALVDATAMNQQVNLLRELEKGFFKTHQATVSEAHVTTVEAALRLMNAKETQAFDLAKEPAGSAGPYGKDPFGRRCLLARRLVEIGVPFVEVGLDGWDMHVNTGDSIRKKLPLVDQVMSQLVTDLKQRGLLDSTLVIWMGEFGRTPDLDKNAGRNHYAKAWSSVLIGGGIKGGQVVGKTDAEGATVVDRPVSIADFLATVCRVLGIDPFKYHGVKPDNRPIRLMEPLNPKGEVKELEIL